MNFKLKLAIDITVFGVLVALVMGAIWISLKNETLPERVKKINKMKQGDISFSFYDLNDNQYNFRDFQNKVVLVNVWATWCAPCVHELPSLIKLARDFKKDFVVIAITDESVMAVKKFLTSFDSLSRNFYVAFNPNVLGIFSPEALPESFLFDQKGKMVEKIIGPRMWDSLEWKIKIRKLIGMS